MFQGNPGLPGAVCGTTGTTYNDVWSFNPATNTWTKPVMAGGPPSARREHTLVYDPVNLEFVLFGGVDASGNPVADTTWTLTCNATHSDIEAGLPLNTRAATSGNGQAAGLLYIQTRILNADLPEGMPGRKKDNSILSTALAMQAERTDTTVTLVTKDINLRIKAAVLGIHAEEYFNDQVLDDVNLLYSGRADLDDDFWDSHGDSMPQMTVKYFDSI